MKGGADRTTRREACEGRGSNFLKATAAAKVPLHCNDFRVNSAATRDATRAHHAGWLSAFAPPSPRKYITFGGAAGGSAVSGMTYEVS